MDVCARKLLQKRSKRTKNTYWECLRRVKAQLPYPPRPRRTDSLHSVKSRQYGVFSRHLEGPLSKFCAEVHLRLLVPVAKNDHRQVVDSTTVCVWRAVVDRQLRYQSQIEIMRVVKALSGHSAMPLVWG